MKLTLLIATTALALSAPAVPHAHAACATYNGTLPVAYWQQKEITDRADRAQWQMFPQNRPIVEAMADATYARVIAESALCEQNAISFYEYKARILEAFTRMGR